MNRYVVIPLSFLFCVPSFFGLLNDNTRYDLPPPLDVEMSLEQVICRRMSVREFTEEPIGDEELSTVLWAAYGFSDGTRNIHGVGVAYAAQVYVLKEDGVYKYDAWNHSLSLWRKGDFRQVGQYDSAPVKLGIVWDSHKCSSEEIACAEIGEIGQNVYFMANALNMGTVTTASEVNQLYFIGLPLWEKPKIIMPLGYPKDAYDFTYNPILSNLPVIGNSSLSLSTAIRERKEGISWGGRLTTQEQTQAVWASYGYSSLIDNVNKKRHRTIPSSQGIYPLRIFVANTSGLYEYIPKEHVMKEIARGDHRNEIAAASCSFISSAPLLIIPVLNNTMIDERYLWPWYYEAGASAYNVLLEATAWNLSANIIPSLDTNALLSLLWLDNRYLPLFIIPVGKEKGVDDEIPPHVTLGKPKEGYMYIFGREIMPAAMTFIIGPFTAVAEANDVYALQLVKFFVDGNAIEEAFSQPYTCEIPLSFTPMSHVMEIKAYDFSENVAVISLKYVKML